MNSYDRFDIALKPTVASVTSFTTHDIVLPKVEWDEKGAAKRGKALLPAKIKLFVGKDITEDDLTWSQGQQLWYWKEKPRWAYTVLYPGHPSYGEDGMLAMTQYCPTCGKVWGFVAIENSNWARTVKEYKRNASKFRCMECNPWTEKELARFRRNKRALWADNWEGEGDYEYTPPLTDIENKLADAPEDFDKAAVEQALATIRKALKGFKP